MAWPTAPTGTVSGGVRVDRPSGVSSTLRWGTASAVTSVNGVAVNGTTVGIILRINEASIVNNIKLPNGDGVTVNRVQIIDGVKWDVTLRDDSGITGRPQPGTAVVIVDMAGLLGTVGLKYTSTVVESSYDASPGQPGEIVVTVENLVLIESQTGS